MKALVFVLLVALVPVAASARTAPARRAASAATAFAAPSLPIRRVTVYSNGVAYIERRGFVTGHAEVSLPFKQSQLDDALKSMVVLDLGKGRVGAVSYASSEPPAARLADIPLEIAPQTSGNDALGGLAGLLRQLQGARVSIAAGPRAVTGAVLTVDQRTSQLDASKPGVTTRTVVLATDDGAIESFDLDQVRSVRLVDENARRNVAEYADASAAARRQDSNTIVVTSDGEGQREMVVGYTIAAPIWKTTYRVVLDDSGTPFFQGWAIVDNVSEDDWSDVALSLVSGTPLSFVQHLQQPFYRPRPEIPIPGDVQLAPQGYEKLAVSETTVQTTITESQIQNLPLAGRNYARLSGQRTGEAGIGLNNQVSVEAQAAEFGAMSVHPSLAAPALSERSGVAAAASGGAVGDLFEYRVENPVTVNRNRSALIPILQTRLDGVRVSVFNESVRGERPLGGVRLKNTSSLVLESGPMAIFDGSSYVGDALIERFKPGEERFVPFSVDLGTLVTVENTEANSPVHFIRAADGVLDAQFYRVRRKTYTLRNQTDTPRVVYVDHAKDDDWALMKETPIPAATTANSYRFRVELGPRATASITVAERAESHDRFSLSSISKNEVALLLERRYIDEPSRAALDRIVEIKTRLAAIETSLEANDEEMTRIQEDQKRLRDNVGSLRQTSEAKALIARYIAKADAQETQLEHLETDRKTAVAEQSRLNGELATAVLGFKFDRKIE